MNRLTGRGILVLFIIALFLVGCTQPTKYSQETTDSQTFTSTNQKTCKDVQVEYTEQEAYLKNETYTENVPYTDLEYYTDTVPYTDKECEAKQLVYNTGGNPAVYPSCAQQRIDCLEQGWFGCAKQQAVCTSYHYTCNLTINNLDDELGVWTVRLQVLNAQKQQLSLKTLFSYYAVDSIDAQYSVQPRSSYVVNLDFNTDIPDIRGLDASYCSISITNVPTKQVCHDVIKYQDVQKSRQVTRYHDVEKVRQVTDYRPVTKYRTETQCT